MVHGFTQALELNWSLKIGTNLGPNGINQKIILETRNVSCGIHGVPMGSGSIGIATKRIFSFVSLSNWCTPLIKIMLNMYDVAVMIG